MREFEIILLQTQSLSVKPFKELLKAVYFYKEHFKTFCEAFVVAFYLKLKLILRIITYLTYICWDIDNFVIKSDIFRRFFICKNILKKLSC
jgi:hypothetical protein